MYGFCLPDPRRWWIHRLPQTRGNTRNIFHLDRTTLNTVQKVRKRPKQPGYPRNIRKRPIHFPKRPKTPCATHAAVQVSKRRACPTSRSRGRCCRRSAGGASARCSRTAVACELALRHGPRKPSDARTVGKDCQSVLPRICKF